MDIIKHDNSIVTERIIKNVWISKVNIIVPVKAEVTQNGVSENDAYQKIIKFIGESREPISIEDTKLGKIYTFKEYK